MLGGCGTVFTAMKSNCRHLMGDNRINSRQSTRGVKVAESEVICICVCLCVFMGGGEGVGAALS